MRQVVYVGDRPIGPGHPAYLIAEVGTTCLGDLDKALALVDACATAGMDAAKFQLIDPDQMSDTSVTYPMVVDGRPVQVNMREMFARLSFTPEQWRRIARHCGAARIDFLATVDFIAGVDVLDAAGIKAHKIGAWDSTYRQLIERIGRTGKPMFADLGPTTVEEADEIVSWYRDAGGSALLFMHDFHTQDDTQMNLRAIQVLNERYPWPAGFSSPARDNDIDIAALSLGAAYLEKRLVLDRSERAFHAHESLDPAELGAWVGCIRHVERALGRPVIEPSTDDVAGKVKYYRSLCTLQAIGAGEEFSAANVGAKRPGTGIPTTRLSDYLGRRAASALPANHLLSDADAI